LLLKAHFWRCGAWVCWGFFWRWAIEQIGGRLGARSCVVLRAAAFLAWIFGLSLTSLAFWGCTSLDVL
jgi:hypothetical protein